MSIVLTFLNAPLLKRQMCMLANIFLKLKTYLYKFVKLKALRSMLAQCKIIKAQRIITYPLQNFVIWTLLGFDFII